MKGLNYFFFMLSIIVLGSLVLTLFAKNKLGFIISIILLAPILFLWRYSNKQSCIKER